MKKYILIPFLFFGLLAQSQTKIIAHKSHSGSVKSFSKAYKNNLFTINNSNFGNPYIPPTVMLDSVISINDSTTILVHRTANFCLATRRVNFEDLDESSYTLKKDTLYNHSFLNRQHSLKYIKSKHKNEYPIHFSNKVSDVEFVGFKK